MDDPEGTDPRSVVENHPLPLGLLFKVFVALVGLTVVTVITGQMSLWGMDLAIAMVIATCKASLVCLFFMHLKYDKPFHVMIFLFSVLFVGLFLAFSALDSGEYQPDIMQRTFDETYGMPTGAEADAAAAEAAGAEGAEGAEPAGEEAGGAEDPGAAGEGS